VTPALAAVPFALDALILYAAVQTWRHTPSRRARVVAAMAIVGLFLAPVANVPLNLNSANGDRELMLPAVGLALLIAVLVGGMRRFPRPAAIGTPLAALAAVTLTMALDWPAAGHLAGVMTTDAAGLLGSRDRLIVLSLPEDYRSARVFTNGFDLALEDHLRRPVTLAVCAPVEVDALGAGVQSFAATTPGAYRGRTTLRAAFHATVLSAIPVTIGPRCSYTYSGSGPPGLRKTVMARPTLQSDVVAYFDGAHLRSLPLAKGATSLR
jgi:hypothetical protein